MVYQYWRCGYDYRSNAGNDVQWIDRLLCNADAERELREPAYDDYCDDKPRCSCTYRGTCCLLSEWCGFTSDSQRFKFIMVYLGHRWYGGSQCTYPLYSEYGI